MHGTTRKEKARITAGTVTALMIVGWLAVIAVALRRLNMNAELRKHVASHSHGRERVAAAVKVGVCNPQNDYRNNRSKNAFHETVTFGNRFRSQPGAA
jgi:hypothetical protein